VVGSGFASYKPGGGGIITPSVALMPGDGVFSTICNSFCSIGPGIGNGGVLGPSIGGVLGGVLGTNLDILILDILYLYFYILNSIFLIVLLIKHILFRSQIPFHSILIFHVKITM
jgi:hypothetical protein